MADDQFFGQFGVSDDTSEFNVHTFMIQQENGLNRSAIPVKILKVHGGGIGTAPTVDVQVMINQTDGLGNPTSHTTIYGIPVARNQGGLSAIINDPVVGDTGHMVISDRDISTFKQKGAQSNPGSFRKNDLADGVYHAALCMQGTPNQYISFDNSNGGITIADKFGNKIEMTSSGITITAATINLVGNVHLGSTGGVPASMEGTVTSDGAHDVSNLATKVWVT